MGCRPYNEAQADEFCRRYGAGENWKDICGKNDFPSADTIQDWIARYPDMAVRYQAARSRKAQGLMDEVIAIADDSSQDFKEDEKGRMIPNYELVNRSKLKCEVRMKTAAMLDREQWGNKLQIETNTTVTHIDNTFDARLKRLQAGVEEFRTRGGNVVELFEKAGFFPKEIIENERKRNKNSNRKRGEHGRLLPEMTNTSHDMRSKRAKEQPKEAEFKDMPNAGS